MTHFISILEKNAVAFADRIAVKTKSSPPLTYRELNQQINQYANYLQPMINPNHNSPRIAIVYHRSLDMLLWMLAAWKVNASFMLIDSGDLQQEGLVKTKLDQIDPQVIVTSTQFKNHREFSKYSSFIYTDDANTKNNIHEKDTQFTFQRPPDNTEAYVITTSGTSNGVAKFVIINHTLASKSGVSALFYDISKLLKLGKGDMVLIDGAVNWDPNICLIGVGLYHGAAIYIAPPEETRNRHSLLLNCIEHHVNVMLVVPSAHGDLALESDLLERMKKNNLRLIFTGEKLTKEIVDCFKSYATGGIYNGYGPSEGPIGITATKVESSDYISIHREMKGRELAIVDSEGRASDNGELIWKSLGFGGYLGNAEETKKKLITFQGETWYRSGDLVEKNGDQLVYLGRADKQIKVMGIFFNPENIGPFLQKIFPGTKAHAIGVISPFTSTEIPVVFYKSKVHVHELKSAVEKGQTAPMIQFIRLADNEELPRTRNGKCDEKALEKKYKEYVTRNIPKTNEVKENLRQIWCEMARVENIADENKSFYETNPRSVQFASLKTALSKNKVIKKLININEITDALTFKQLIELASQTNRSDLVKYVDPEKIDYPVIIIDDAHTEDYRGIAPNSPLIIVLPSNPKDTPENKLLDAHKTIKQVGIEGPYFVVQVLGDDVYAWGYWRNLPSQFYFFDKVATLEGLQKVLVPAIENAITEDITKKLSPHRKWSRNDSDRLLFPIPVFVFNDKSSLEKQFVQLGFFRKHLTRLSKAEMLIELEVDDSNELDSDKILREIRALGLNELQIEAKYIDGNLKRMQFHMIKGIEPPHREYDDIVKFYNAERSENPLILFAPFTGEDVYAEFCRKIKAPCMVIINPLLAETNKYSQLPFNSLYELANFYSQVINHYQPKGQINLAGWSFGGLMAVAVAQELRKRDEDKKRLVNYVGIIDTAEPNYLSSSAVLMERIQWIIKTYVIPHQQSDIEKMNPSDQDHVWKLLSNLVNKMPDEKNRLYVSKIIQVCQQHFNFGFEQVRLIQGTNYQLYVARNTPPPGGIITFFQHDTAPTNRNESLGWKLPPCYILGTDHFSILDSAGLRKSIARHCKLSRSSNVNVQETLKSLVISQLPQTLNPTENPELLVMIDDQNIEDNNVILQDKSSDNTVAGLHLLQGIWKNYLSDPAKNVLPIYIDLKERTEDSLQAFFDKLHLSPTQPHYIDQMNIIFIIDHVEVVDANELVKDIRDFPIDLTRHPVIWLCDKEHYEQNPILHEQLKLGHELNLLDTSKGESPPFRA